MRVTKSAEQFCAATDGGANFQTVHTDRDPSLVGSFLVLALHWLETSLQFGKGRLQSWNEQTQVFQCNVSKFYQEWGAENSTSTKPFILSTVLKSILSQIIGIIY